MTKFGRLWSVLSGIFMILGAAILFANPQKGLGIVVLMISLVLLLYGVRYLWYYFSMARHMVGGRIMMYIGLLSFAVGIFTFSLSDNSEIYIILYLIGTHAFSGLVDLLHGFQAGKMGDGRGFIINLIQGGINFTICVLCIVFIRSSATVSLIYGLGLVYSAIGKIVSAFRRTAIVYIQ